ncbi:4-alpha-glucanotransferase [Aquifex aeolicus]|uniref:4-alpha-glucanotransferase n=1 Tax=Aquifex aeolicus (strain VF5) TaxID=224324 RepID=MALQ_AQUAE|nr:4-alpha-glucanotransferase [Aquifex aeolicus]O66937.1 RecName: Full=4-alpha-glucanotransferase; AltName: Full=Amylomaltase; AltName: Full=Disproportionating enzyme; Short=D-enzyme [Aquifex aeolicus VF5]AAC06897.1 4-alpha-glucanotransferase (amylomaltase) [Aquifex aeolicus VF5]
MRLAGILLHVTSLPSPYGIGDLGKEAYRFLDFLKECGFSLWQVLPLNPTSLEAGNSPYSSNSLFAGNYVLIDPEELLEEDLIKERDLKRFPLGEALYEVVYEYKKELLEKAFKNFRRFELLEDFLKEHSYWLRDYALYMAIKEEEGKEWYEWDEELKRREKEALKRVLNKLKGRFYFHVFVQFVFFKQWEKLRRYARERGISIVGDLPMYPSYSSADVWTNPELFKLDGDLKPLFVAGVPPDFFSKTGQLWGNPVYNWEEHEKEGFRWWIRRVHHNLKLFDFLRLDHFRGFEAYWEVPYGEETAVNGRWVKAPGKTLFKKLLSYFPKNPFIAEDLGFITDEVRYLRETFKIPGSRVIEFAFYDKESEHLPHNVEENNVYYTSTHDLPPIRGWFENLGEESRKRLFEYLGREIKEEKVNEELIRLVLISRAKFAIIQMQDLLNLGNEARMNYPGRPFGNWRWRIKEDYTQKKEFIKKLLGIYGREV